MTHRSSPGRWVILAFALAAGQAVCAARAVEAQATITVGSTSGPPGALVAFAVTLQTTGTDLPALQADISFDGVNTPIRVNASGGPDCTASSTLTGLGATVSFAFLPNACTGSACNTVRAIVMNMDPHVSIPTGSTLYTCNVQIASAAAVGIYPLDVSGVVAVAGSGIRLEASGVDGQVTVSAPGGGGC
jgi:hypothetical protein